LVLALIGLGFLIACEEPATPTPIVPPSPTTVILPATPTSAGLQPPTPIPTIPLVLPSFRDLTLTANPPTLTPLPTTTPAPTQTPDPTHTAWQPSNLTAYHLEVVVSAPGVPSTLYAGGEESVYGGKNGVFRSTDGGHTWMQRNTTLPVDTLAVAASDPNIIYAGTRMGCDSGEPGTLVGSADGGSTWTTVQGGPWNIDINPADPDHLIALQCDGVYRSTDGGRSWSKLSGTGIANHTAVLLARGVNDRKVIYVAYATEGGNVTIQRTMDDARTWQTLHTANFYNPHDLAVDPADARHVYFVGAQAFYSSADAGQSWNLHNEGLNITAQFEGNLAELAAWRWIG